MQVKLTDTFTFDDDNEYELAITRVKVKVPQILNGKRVNVEKWTRGVKVFADGSIAVKKKRKRNAEDEVEDDAAGQRPGQKKRKKV